MSAMGIGGMMPMMCKMSCEMGKDGMTPAGADTTNPAATNLSGPKGAAL